MGTCKVHEFEDAEALRKRCFLRRHPDLAARSRPPRIATEKTGDAFVRRAKAEQYVEGGCLPGAVWTEQRDNVAGVDGEAHVIEGCRRPELLRNVFKRCCGQVAPFERDATRAL